MNLRKGFLRILVFVLCFFLCLTLAIAMSPLFGSPFTFDDVFYCLTTFEYAFSVVVVLILVANFAEPETDRFFDTENRSTRIVVISSIIAGSVGLAIYSHVRPTGPHVGAYLMAFMIPFMLIFGAYLSVLWIAEGFRKSV
jgi:hypothetical protein